MVASILVMTTVVVRVLVCAWPECSKAAQCGVRLGPSTLPSSASHHGQFIVAVATSATWPTQGLTVHPHEQLVADCHHDQAGDDVQGVVGQADVEQRQPKEHDDEDGEHGEQPFQERHAAGCCHGRARLVPVRTERATGVDADAADHQVLQTWGVASASLLPVGTLETLLVGALLTLAAQALLQLVVIPKVEARKRREDRWEKDVLAMGELLTAELPAVASAAMTASIRHAYVRSQVNGKEAAGDIAAAADEEFEATFGSNSAAWLAFDSLSGVRVPWLTKRIVALAPTAAPVKALERAALGYRAARERLFPLAVSGLQWGTEDVSIHELDAAWQAEVNARRGLLAVTELLLTLPHPPRRSLRVRARQGALHLGAPLRRVRARWQVRRKASRMRDRPQV